MGKEPGKITDMDRIVRALNAPSSGRVVTTPFFTRPTWDESADNLTRIVRTTAGEPFMIDIREYPAAGVPILASKEEVEKFFLAVRKEVLHLKKRQISCRRDGSPNELAIRGILIAYENAPELNFIKEHIVTILAEEEKMLNKD